MHLEQQDGLAALRQPIADGRGHVEDNPGDDDEAQRNKGPRGPREWLRRGCDRRGSLPQSPNGQRNAYEAKSDEQSYAGQSP